MTHFLAAMSDELEKLAGDIAQSFTDLARTQKLEDGANDPALGYKPKIGIGKLGPAAGGPLLADPSRYPFNRLAP